MKECERRTQSSPLRDDVAALTDRQRIGNALREARISAGMTTRELEEITGISNGELSRIENGRRNAGMDTIARIASVFGLRVGLVKE